MGGGQPRAAVEAVADVAHGGRVVLLLCTHKSFGICRVFVKYPVEFFTTVEHAAIRISHDMDSREYLKNCLIFLIL